MTRFILSTLLAGVLGTAALCGLSWAGDDANKCKLAMEGDSPTAKACASGGIKAAKKAMKKMVADAKEKGDKSFTCEGCHKDLDNYELTKNGKDDFKKLRALLAK